MMTENEKREMLQTITGETNNAVLSAYLSIAADKVCRKAFPFDFDETVVPDRYARVQVEIAAYLIQKRGAEGELSHTENGISRAYENGDVPSSLTRDITPFAATM